MSKRGRRRSSRRRKSSSSSKQSASSQSVKHNKSNSVGWKDEVVEKGEADSQRKENAQESEDEEKDDISPPDEKRFKHDSHVSSNPHPRSLYTKTTEDTETGLKIITSVSFSDSEDSAPNITFQQRQDSTERCSSTPLTNIMKFNCSASGVKLEIQEILQLNSSGLTTTYVFTNEKEDTGGTWTPGQRSQSESLHGGDQNTNYRFTFGNLRNQTEADLDSMVEVSNCRCCAGHHRPSSSSSSGLAPPPNLQHQQRRRSFRKSFSADEFWDVPPPREFADSKLSTLEQLSLDLMSCRIGSRPDTRSSLTHEEEGEDESERADRLSESETYEASFGRPSLSTNRSSFTKQFIRSQKRRSWIRNNSISTVERRACPLPQKRRQTFPGTSDGVGLMSEDLLLPCDESFSSLIMCLRPLQTETSAFGRDDSIQSEPVSEIPNGLDETPTSRGTLCATSSEENPEEVGQRGPKRDSIRIHRPGVRPRDVCGDTDSPETDECEGRVGPSAVAYNGCDQEAKEPRRRGLSIQVIPPSCSGSEEQVEQSQDPLHLRSSVTTLTVGALERRFLHLDLGTPPSEGDDLCLTSAQDGDLYSVTCEATARESKPPAEETLNTSATTEETKDLIAGSQGAEPRRPATGGAHTEVQTKDSLSETSRTNPHVPSRGPLEPKEHLRPVMFKEPEGGASSDHLAMRRKLFRESRQWSSAGGSSVTSDLTEESVSEDARSMDMSIRDNEDGGFYMETFHASAWIYQGDEAVPGAAPPSIAARARAVSVRERTVRISRGSGDYPWGFRIQFSKPIVVTEVDTNGCAEEAGLTVGDFVLAVNGTDVTSVPHSEAAELARQGPEVLTLTIGSDIAKGPNTPRPACRGYLHKRTQSGLIRGWRKRWFVLSQDNCLCYYRHKRDEGRRRALSALQLDAAEVGQDVSLGKPFVFKCRPPSVNRVFFFCATSNQEMKRWLEAMERAVRPVAQNHVWVDVTRHNSNLPPLAVKSPECLGLLHKMDKNKDVWLQHYCVLKDACLYLYSGIRATHAHGGIYLQGYTVREQPYGFKKSTMELKPPSDEFKSFYLCAENPSENKRWLVAIKSSIKKWLPLHQALQEYMNQPPEETRM